MKTTYDENTGIFTAQYPPGTTLKAGTTFTFQVDEITRLKRRNGWYLAKKHFDSEKEIVYFDSGRIDRAGGRRNCMLHEFHFISPTPLNLEELAEGGGV